MRLLITGHKGFIGSNAVKYFQKTHSIKTYDWADGSLPNLVDIDCVMHFGAVTSTVERDVDKLLRHNYDFTVKLINKCRALGIRLQFSSTASIYGLGTNFKETAAPDPRTPYAWTKYLCERYAQAYPSDNIIQMFRYFNVYGPGEDSKGNQASPYHKFTKQAKEQGRITVFENSDQYFRDFVHVDQIISIHDKFLNIDQSGVWNAGSGQTKSFMDVALEISNQYSAEIDTIPMPQELIAGYQKYTCADLTKLRETLNESNG